MESYIVRIYRRPSADGNETGGTVQVSWSGTLSRFRSGKELLAILNLDGDALPAGGSNGADDDEMHST